MSMKIIPVKDLIKKLFFNEIQYVFYTYYMTKHHNYVIYFTKDFVEKIQLYENYYVGLNSQLNMFDNIIISRYTFHQYVANSDRSYVLLLNAEQYMLYKLSNS